MGTWLRVGIYLKVNPDYGGWLQGSPTLVSSMQMKEETWEPPQGSRHPQLLSIPICQKSLKYHISYKQLITFCMNIYVLI